MEHTETNKNSFKRKGLIALLLLLIILGSSYIFSRRESPVQVTSKELLPALTNAQDRPISEIAQEVADANYFTLNISPVAIFSDGASEGSVEIINPEKNVYPISVVFTLDETGEEVYQSGAIYPNQEIRSAKLNRTLEKGEHAATATIHIFDPETLEKRGATQAGLTFIIKN